MADDIIKHIDDKHREAYKELLDNLRGDPANNSNEPINRAFLLLCDAKKGEKTEYDQDVIQSALNTALIAVHEIGLGRTSVISFFIYKAKEAVITDYNEVKNNFNGEVAVITEGLAKIDTLDEKTSSSQAENFRRLLLNLARDVRVILLRLAEQLEVMREMKKCKREDQLKIASESAFLYAPLAHRLGLYLVKSEMEDLSLKYTDRDTYSMIAKKLAETMRARRSFIREFITPIEKELTRQGFDFEIKGRPKSIHSIWNKMKRKEVEFEDIYDLFAIRIILRSELKNEKADCWQVYSAVTDIYQPNPLRLRDWI